MQDFKNQTIVQYFYLMLKPCLIILLLNRQLLHIITLSGIIDKRIWKGNAVSVPPSVLQPKNNNKSKQRDKVKFADFY